MKQRFVEQAAKKLARAIDEKRKGGTPIVIITYGSDKYDNWDDDPKLNRIEKICDSLGLSKIILSEIFENV